jgi:hypothetical protein
MNYHFLESVNDNIIYEYEHLDEGAISAIRGGLRRVGRMFGAGARTTSRMAGAAANKAPRLVRGAVATVGRANVRANAAIARSRKATDILRKVTSGGPSPIAGIM